MVKFQSNLNQTMKYNLSAVETLNILGYDQPTGKDWLDKIKRDNNLNLPRTYVEFMELMADCPLLGTSNLWVGKMSHGTCIPRTLYETIQEMIDDRKGQWSKCPSEHERSLYELFQIPVKEWPKKMDNYLLIGSDYANGMGDFGIRMQDLQEEDPPVYWRRDTDSFSTWELENEQLSDFLQNVLIEVLACVDYQSAEYALETKGWRYEEYFDIEKDDWIATKSVLERYGIDFSELKKYKANTGNVFCCYDENRKAFFVGHIMEDEISLYAINCKEAENIFPDMDSLE